MPKFQNPLEFQNQLSDIIGKGQTLKKLKRASKLPQKYIDRVYDMGSNKTTREIPGGLKDRKDRRKIPRMHLTPAGFCFMMSHGLS